MGRTDEGDYELHDQETSHRGDHVWIQAKAKEASALGSDNWTVEGLSWRGRPPRARAEKQKKHPFQWITGLLRRKK